MCFFQELQNFKGDNVKYSQLKTNIIKQTKKKKKKYKLDFIFFVFLFFFYCFRLAFA